MNYNELKSFYNKHFSLGYLNTDIKNKFALISLVCEVTRLSKLKNPGVTHYQILAKINESVGLPDEFIDSLSIICEDFAYGCKEFITFGLKPKEFVTNIKSILSTYVPF